MVVGAYYALSCFFSVKREEVIASVRTVQLNDTEMDYQAILNEFEDSELTTEGSLTTFTGYQTLNSSLFEGIDNVSESDVEVLDECNVGYKFTYDYENGIVTICAEMNNEHGEIEIDEMSGMAFLNDNDEIDAIFMMEEGENILLSDLRDAGMINNAGWLSRVFEAVVVATTTVVATVATVVTATAGAAATVAVAVASTVAYNKQEQAQADKNYEANKKLDNTVSGVINGQSNYKDWKFGAKTFDYNGCGVIATYNVMTLLGHKVKLSEIAYEFESKKGTFVWGLFGTDPSHPYEYFKEKGIKVEQYLSYSKYEKAFRNMNTNQCAMVCFWNNKKNIKEGAHFVAVKKNANDKYEVFNYENNNQYSKTFTSLSAILANKKMIVGLIVG